MCGVLHCAMLSTSQSSRSHHAHGVCGVWCVGVCVCVGHHASLSSIAALIRCKVVMATRRYQERYTQCELLLPLLHTSFYHYQSSAGIQRQRRCFSSPQSCAVRKQHFHIWTSGYMLLLHTQHCLQSTGSTVARQPPPTG